MLYVYVSLNPFLTSLWPFALDKMKRQPDCTNSTRAND